MTTKHDHDSNDSGRTQQFVDLFLEQQRGIYRYILTLVGNPHDADDILQDTSRVLWEKFDTFEQGTNFRAWATRIAHHKVLDHRRRQGKQPQLLDDTVLEFIASRSQREQPRMSLVKEALLFCINRLKLSDKKLIQSRYQPDYDRHRVAKELNRPPNSITKSLSRIRRQLLECVCRRVDRLESEE